MFFKFFIVIVCLTGELLVSVVLVGVTFFCGCFSFFSASKQESKQGSKQVIPGLLPCPLACLLAP